ARSRRSGARRRSGAPSRRRRAVAPKRRAADARGRDRSGAPSEIVGLSAEPPTPPSRPLELPSRRFEAPVAPAHLGEPAARVGLAEALPPPESVPGATPGCDARCTLGGRRRCDAARSGLARPLLDGRADGGTRMTTTTTLTRLALAL